MKRVLFYVLACGAFLAAASLISPNGRGVKAATDTATLSTTIQEYMSFSLTAGDTVGFGTLTPGTPVPAPAGGTVATVTTNASNGYTLGVSDAVASTNSALLHTDTTTRIPDYAGTIGTPTAWTSTGLGITLFAADTNYESKWCVTTCTTYDDTDNKYAGVPQAATTAHTVTTYDANGDTSSWAFKLDVENTQKTGAYSGDVTFTATAVLS